MYVWSILERHVPTFGLPGNCGINCQWHIRRGRYCLVPELVIRPRQQFKRYDMEVSLYEAPCKQALDTFLKTIPDDPKTPGYTYMRRAESNSLIHMTPLTTARHPSISEELDNVPQARGGHPWSPRD